MSHILQQQCKATPSLSNGKKSVQNPRQYRVASENEDGLSILPALLAPLSDGVSDIIIFVLSVDNDIGRTEENEEIDDLGEDSNESEELIDGTNMLSTANQLQMLRMSSCNRKKAKQCLRACYSAFRNVCNSYPCSSRFKTKAKRGCKRSCRSNFSE